MDNRMEHAPMPSLMNELRAFLDAQGPGPVVDKPGLVGLLTPVWSDLLGAHDEAMASWKLGRMDKPDWRPPLLTFDLERHGGFVKGSTRADVQTWTVDLDAETAAHKRRTYRQLLPRAAAFHVEPVITQVVRLVVDGVDHEWLSWSTDRQTVTVRISLIITATGPKQTYEGRRKRLQARLKTEMTAVGWAPGTTGWRYVVTGAQRRS